MMDGSSGFSKLDHEENGAHRGTGCWSPAYTASMNMNIQCDRNDDEYGIWTWLPCRVCPWLNLLVHGQAVSDWVNLSPQDKDLVAELVQLKKSADQLRALHFGVLLARELPPVACGQS